MRTWWKWAALAGLLAACVSEDTALAYAQRAHPECRAHRVLAHSYNAGGKEGGSLTEISMACGETARSISVKCSWGTGCISDTVCHENN